MSLAAVAAVVTLALITYDVLANRDATERHVGWERLVDAEYRVYSAEAWANALGGAIDSIDAHVWTERDDPYLLNNNGGYFMVCGTAISMSSGEHYTQAHFSTWSGESPDGDRTIVEAYAFAAEGIEFPQLLARTAELADTCDDYYRPAPGWSWDRGTVRTVASVAAEPMRGGQFDSVRITEGFAEGDGRVTRSRATSRPLNPASTGAEPPRGAVTRCSR